MPDLPSELAAFSYLLDTQPVPVRDAFHYCLCVLMVETGKMRLVEKIPAEPVLASPRGPGNGEICVFETVARVKFRVTRPVLSRDQEAALIDVLREILKDEGM